MKKIHIQDVPRRTLEDVVLAISDALETCRQTIGDVLDADKHKVLTRDEFYARLGDLGFSFYNYVWHTFVDRGWIAKPEDAEGGAE